MKASEAILDPIDFAFWSMINPPTKEEIELHRKVQEIHEKQLDREESERQAILSISHKMTINNCFDFECASCGAVIRRTTLEDNWPAWAKRTDENMALFATEKIGPCLVSGIELDGDS